MAHIETLSEIVEGLAVSLGVGKPITYADQTRGIHADDCGCRACWCVRMEGRIRHAVEFERLAQRVSHLVEEETGASGPHQRQRMLETTPDGWVAQTPHPWTQDCVRVGCIPYQESRP